MIRYYVVTDLTMFGEAPATRKYGPFATRGEAQEWADRNAFNSTYEIVEEEFYS